MRALIVSADAVESGDAPLLDRDAAESAPLGSIFKLYVLLAVAHAVDHGTLDWDDTVTVTEQNRSLPSGQLQDEPDGTEVSVQEAAAAMIAISDNTATDMLIHAVGREAVEQAVADSGHHDPELMTPFMTTREMFQVGWGNPENLETWTTGTEQEQRDLVEQLEHAPIGPHDIAVGGNPVWPAGVDWFASAEDIAAVQVALHELEDPVVRNILSKNPGVQLSPQNPWDYVGFKGGSSLGVLTGSWFVENKEGDQFVVVIQTATDDAAGISAEAHTLFIHLATSALELVGE